MTQIRVPVTGFAGTPGPAGPAGSPGVGVPVGGVVGEFLGKSSATDYATSWQVPAGSGSANLVNGQFRVITTGTNPAAAYPGANIVAQGANAVIFGIANIGGGNTQWGGGLRAGYTGLSADGGLRFEQNLHRPSAGADALYNPGLPRGVLGMDSLGTFSYEKEPAVDNSNGEQHGFTGVSNSPWDFFTVYGATEAAQSLIIDQMYQVSGIGGGSFAGHVKVATMRQGHTLGFYTSNIKNDPRPAMWITAHAQPGNVNINRALILLAESPTIAPIKFIEQTGGNEPTVGSAGDGAIWFNGTDFKCKVAGVIYTLQKV